MQIVSRAGWDARPPRSRFLIPVPTPKLWLHHTASPTGGPARVRAIQNFHMDVRGWSDIAYSFLVSAAGVIYEGRGAGVAGGHTAGQNTVSHAICAMGNYDTTVPSDPMLASIRALLAHGHQKGWWPAKFTGGHRDAPGAATSCPGAKLYALLPELNRPLPEDDTMRFIEARGETGPHVEYWQRIMMAIDVPWKPTAYGVWNAHSIEELQDLTGPGENLGPGEAAALHAKLAQSGSSGGLNDAQVRQIVSETGRTLFVEKGQPVVIRGS